MRPAVAGSAGTLRNRRLRLIGLSAGAIAAVPICDSPAAAQSQVMLRPAAGVAGTVVQVTGRGFPAGHPVTVDAGQRRLAVRSPNDRGRFTARIRMPTSPTTLRLVSSAGKRRVVSIFRQEHEPTRTLGRLTHPPAGGCAGVRSTRFRERRSACAARGSGQGNASRCPWRGKSRAPALPAAGALRRSRPPQRARGATLARSERPAAPSAWPAPSGEHGPGRFPRADPSSERGR